MKKELKKELQEVSEYYDSPLFVKYDYSHFVHWYDKECEYISELERKQNIEIAAFIASWLVVGSRENAQQSIDKVLFEIVGPKPYQFIASFDRVKYKNNDREKICKKITYGDLFALFARLRVIYSKFKTLEDAVSNDMSEWHVNALKGIQITFQGVPHIPLVTCMAGYQGLNLFLRWMVRKSDVDFGLWSIESSENLIISYRDEIREAANALGFTSSKTDTLANAKSLTQKMMEVYPDDPCKAEYGLLSQCNNPLLPKLVKFMSMGDLLSTQVFVDELHKSIDEVEKKRETWISKVKLLGRKPKRITFDTLKELGIMSNHISMIHEWLHILERKSHRPKAQRELIHLICNRARVNALNILENEEKKRIDCKWGD